MIVLSPNDSQIRQVLRSFLLAVLPAGVEVVLGQDNRVPEPKSSDFVVMTRIGSGRLATNVDSYADAAYTGSISGTVLTVTNILIGSVVPGATLFGTGVATGTVIGTQISGTPGGVGTYNISPSQTVASEVLASGVASAMMETEVLYQLDVHGPNSNDNAEIISTLMRDQWGVEQFIDASSTAGIAIGSVIPLHADNPKQIGFVNDQQQWEYRWIVEARIQANQVTMNLPQQFASAFAVTLESVDVEFPP